MPNWVQNQLTILGTPEEIQTFRAAIESAPDTPEYCKSQLDFNRIDPMPADERLEIHFSFEGLMGYAAFHTHEDAQRFLSGFELLKMAGVQTLEELQAHILKTYPEAKELGDRYAENMRRHGAKTMYEWALAHWGTKWNAFDVTIVDRIWSPELATPSDRYIKHPQTCSCSKERMICVRAGTVPSLGLLARKPEAILPFAPAVLAFRVAR